MLDPMGGTRPRRKPHIEVNIPVRSLAFSSFARDECMMILMTISELDFSNVVRDNLTHIAPGDVAGGRRGQQERRVAVKQTIPERTGAD